jgi:hypothetical protein
LVALLKRYRYQFLIVLIGLCVLEGFDLLLQLGRQTVVYPDSLNYLESAQNMYLHGKVHYYRPMLMAFITGLPYLFGSVDAMIFKWSLFVNVFCWIGTAVILFGILKDFVTWKLAFWFAISSFFVLGNLALNFHLLTENIFVFVVMLAFYLLFQYYKTHQFRYLSLCLALLLSGMLIKPGAKFFALIICLFFLKEIFSNYKQKSIIFLYGSLLLILIQAVGMRIQYGNFTISYIDGVTYHNYICSKADCLKNGKEYNQIDNRRAAYLFSLSYPDQKRVALEDLKHQIKTNSPNLVRAYFSDVLENSKTGNTCIQDLQNKEGKDSFDFWKNFAFHITKWQNRILTLLGVFFSVFFLFKTYKKPNPVSFISFFVLYIIVLSGISCGQGDRFHLVAFPFTLLLLAKFLLKTKRIKPFSGPPQK